MKENETFTMTYSASQQEEIENIRKKYLAKEENKTEQLRALDAGATKKASIRAITIGSAGALVMGIGMSLIMSDFGNLLGAFAFPFGIGIGILGIAILSLAYPLYHKTLKEERARIAPEILRLSSELLK